MTCKQSAMYCRELLACALLALAPACAARTHHVYNSVQNLDKNSKVKYNPVLENRFNDPNTVVFEAPRPVNEQFPSAVLFGRTCGGTILSEKWILTAGHCTLFTGGRDVLAGTNNTENDTGVRRRVKKLYLHPLFTVGPYWLDAKRFNITQVAARWDFLLAELEEPLPLDGKTIKAVTLESFDIQPGTPVGYGGFGAEHHGETMRHQMHGMKMQTLADSDCNNLLQYNPEDMLCATGVKPDYDSACNGDSGSGLVDEHNRLLGVASWVEEDALRCFNGAKVIFSKVPAARPWIRQITGL